jgi:hypothetical protein
MSKDPFGFSPTGNTLRDAADALRQKTAPKTSDRKPPEENGIRLATIPRGEDEELRLSWAEYNGRNFLNIRMWHRQESGWWPDKSKGMTVRVHELPDFAEGIAQAIDKAKEAA